MGIRSAAKAVILHRGKVLLNMCRDEQGRDYYSLPGGGQNPYETLAEAVIRECREETGYSVVPVGFAALYEEIRDDAAFREAHPNYAHKIYHIFLCALADEQPDAATQTDDMQIGCEWVRVEDLKDARLLPKPVAASMQAMLDGGSPLYLGSDHVDLLRGQ